MSAAFVLLQGLQYLLYTSESDISHGLEIAVPVLSSDAVYLLGLYDFCILLPQSRTFLSEIPSREHCDSGNHLLQSNSYNFIFSLACKSYRLFVFEEAKKCFLIHKVTQDPRNQERLFYPRRPNPASTAVGCCRVSDCHERMLRTTRGTCIMERWHWTYCVH